MFKKNKQIVSRLKAEVSGLTPDILPQLLCAKNQQKGNIIDMNTQTTPKKRKSVFYIAIAAAAALVIVLSSVTMISLQYKIDATIGIDVNPSVELKINSRDKVVSATPLNQDAEIILGDMDLKGTNVTVAANAVIGAMVQSGYIDELKNSVLITVNDASEERAAQLRTQLGDSINAALSEQSITAAVFSQTAGDDAQVAALADQYGISIGKAYWVSRLAGADSTLSVELLSQLSINDLALLASARNLNGEVTASGTASDKGYIGSEKATQIALENAPDATVLSSKLDYEDGRMVYEIELIKDNVKYEFDIDAATGEVVKSDMESTTVTPSTTTNPDDLISRDKAQSLALERAPGATLIKLELDYDDGVEVYEGELRNGNIEYDFKINAVTGAFIKWEKETKNTQSGAGTQSGSASGSTATSGSTGSSTSGGSSSGTASSSSYIGEQKAKEIALAKVSGATLAYIKLDIDDDGDDPDVYEGKLYKDDMEYEFEIDALTGGFVKWEQERREGYSSNNNNASSGNYIGIERAKEIALEKVPGATVVEIELDIDDDGREAAKYEGELRKDGYEYEFEIDASSGKILKWEQDRDD